MKNKELPDEIIHYIEAIKDLLSAEIWNNLLLDCTKNEIFTLWLIYQKQEVNMSQIAEYIHAPLNTATGVIARMEKKKLIVRERSMEDKRVVIIRLGEQGEQQLHAIIKEIMYYAGKVFAAFNQEELSLLMRMWEKLLKVLKEERDKEGKKKSRVRKIEIL